MTCSFPPFCALPQASRTRIKELRWLLLSLKRNSLFSAQNTWSTFFFFKPFMQISLKIHCSRTFTQRVLLFRFWPLPSISQRSDSKFYNAQISFLPNHSFSNVFMWTPPTQVWLEWLVMVVKNERQAQETGFCFIFEKESMNIMKKKQKQWVWTSRQSQSKNTFS